MKTFKTFIAESLTKTEKALLDQAHKNGRKQVSVTHEIGRKGGGNSGARELKAFHSLVKKGHLVHDKGAGGSSSDYTRDKKKRERRFVTFMGHVHPDSTYKPGA
jgi:hypothetical protein